MNEKDLAAYKQKGRGTLAGQVFLGSLSGKAITQAGVPVHLIPVSPYTRYWFDHNVRTTGCISNDDPTANDGLMSRQQADCARDGLAQFLTEKRLLPYLRTTRANPTGHFWFMKIPAGRYYLVSLIEGGGGVHQDERAAGIAWLTIELEAGEKATNLVVTNCRSGLC
ncbi:MAG: hypothetical protein BVN28_00565 [Nitrospira sp. ST-bin4]|nr:MAG: hypothetical protein BVN28_00565 [Nitrospira sp. ST-bin4]